jgi:hypothetical protein
MAIEQDQLGACGVKCPRHSLPQVACGSSDDHDTIGKVKHRQPS